MPDPRPSMTWTDALILAAVIFGLLMGVSILSYEVAIGLGLLALCFVLFKLLTTQPK